MDRPPCSAVVLRMVLPDVGHSYRANSRLVWTLELIDWLYCRHAIARAHARSGRRSAALPAAWRCARGRHRRGDPGRGRAPAIGARSRRQPRREPHDGGDGVPRARVARAGARPRRARDVRLRGRGADRCAVRLARPGGARRPAGARSGAARRPERGRPGDDLVRGGDAGPGAVPARPVPPARPTTSCGATRRRRSGSGRPRGSRACGRRWPGGWARARSRCWWWPGRSRDWT